MPPLLHQVGSTSPAWSRFQFHLQGGFCSALECVSFSSHSSPSSALSPLPLLLPSASLLPLPLLSPLQMLTDFVYNVASVQGGGIHRQVSVGCITLARWMKVLHCPSLSPPSLSPVSVCRLTGASQSALPPSVTQFPTKPLELWTSSSLILR